MSDKNTKPTTRPLTCRGDWELLEDSVSHIKLGQQYGRITTRSFYSSHTNDPVDYEVNLSTNSSMLNMLDEKYIYSIPGKIIIPNSKCQPTMTYFHERVTKICSKSHRIDDSTNKTTVAGIGWVLSANKVKPGNDEHEKGSLILIVSHSDWDPVERVVTPFNVKYILPASPRLVNAHKLVGVGRDFLFDGFLAGRDLEENMAIVELLSLQLRAGLGVNFNVALQIQVPMPAEGDCIITYSGIEEPQASTSNTTLDNGIVQESTNTADVAGAETLDEPFVEDDEVLGDDLPLSSTPLGKRKGKKPANSEAAKKKKEF
ncbi:hypothetical protein Pst134EA_013116 [Puccinia striiformis f. sp. tritici]|uniref:hypothetical protein n=1 Tax=Puccinia striiformis f. sp. tritici TaxID=168172 RepID=UPI002007871C|nr:hypothetical protein Pst134EA_013116 [Puccinia striiformis f. sp. tritici]KAH9465225.1 hypothetical protein Pst134EA_013116 [Puccinia striiformis f. sp. tritici]